jgi:hypothetical protein
MATSAFISSKTMSRVEERLISASDAFVSLHRSEGFQFSSPKLLLGKPAIGTGYSGNTDFLNDRTGYPVPMIWCRRRRRIS